MHIMSLMSQTYKSAAHRDHVIVRMRRENQHGLRERRRTYRSCRIIRIRFPSRPACNSMLQIIENINIDFIVRSEQLHKLPKRILQIILQRKLQYRLIHLLAQPYYRLSDKLRRPLATTNHPWRSHSRQFGSRSLIRKKCNIIVQLQIRSRVSRTNITLNNILHCFSLLFTPRHQNNPLSRQHRINPDSQSRIRCRPDIPSENTRLTLPLLIRQQHCPRTTFP